MRVAFAFANDERPKLFTRDQARLARNRSNQSMFEIHNRICHTPRRDGRHCGSDIPSIPAPSVIRHTLGRRDAPSTVHECSS